MISDQNAILFFTIVSLILFAFTFWRDATREGFSSDKIFNTFFTVIIFAIIGGKILFRPLSIKYFQYEIFTSPFILEGILVGAILGAIVMAKKYKWSFWKIGDMLAPALALFQAVLGFGFFVVTANVTSLLTAIAFMTVYFVMRFLKNNYFLGSSSKVIMLKRLDLPTFTGGLFAVYLTGSSLIAMIFLVSHQNIHSKFWWFQVIFYLLVLVSTYYLIRKQLKHEEVTMSPFKVFGAGFISKLSGSLTARSKEISFSKKRMDKKDPFTQEAEGGARRSEELGDEVTDLREHEELTGEKALLDQEQKEIDKTMNSIKKGTYGICKNCGAKISKARLEAYPTADTCINCEKKLSK